MSRRFERLWLLLVMYRLIGIIGVFWGIGSVKNACNYQSDTDSFEADLTIKMVSATNIHNNFKISNTRLSAKYIS